MNRKMKWPRKSQSATFFRNCRAGVCHRRNLTRSRPVGRIFRLWISVISPLLCARVFAVTNNAEKTEKGLPLPDLHISDLRFALRGRRGVSGLGLAPAKSRRPEGARYHSGTDQQTAPFK